MPLRPTTRHILPLVLIALGCAGEDTGVLPNERLCNGEGGLGALILGRAEPVEFCLDDGDVSVLLTAADRYDIAGQVITPEAVFQIRMVFALRSDAPVTLGLAATLGDAVADPALVWLHYEEIPDGGDAIASSAASGGAFRLSFSDDKVLTGTFDGVTFAMRDVASGDDAGTRRVSEGFFSLSVKSPAAAGLDHAARSR